MTPEVCSVQPLAGHRLLVSFATGERRIFDAGPYITGDWYGRLADAAYFAAVRPRGRTVQWPDGQDIAPHELYEHSQPAE